jgi:capsular polysaccharide biosynthesis protein
LLRDTIAQWQARVAQAQDSLSLAQYSSTSSARLIDMGTALVGSPQLTSPPVIGDLSSLKPAAAALIAGLLIILAYLVLLGRADQTVRDPRSIERRLGVPVVATIPKLAGSRGV